MTTAESSEAAVILDLEAKRDPRTRKVPGAWSGGVSGRHTRGTGRHCWGRPTRI